MGKENKVFELVFKIGETEYRRYSDDRQFLHDKWEWFQKNLSDTPTGEHLKFISITEHRKNADT